MIKSFARFLESTLSALSPLPGHPTTYFQSASRTSEFKSNHIIIQLMPLIRTLSREPASRSHPVQTARPADTSARSESRVTAALFTRISGCLYFELSFPGLLLGPNRTVGRKMGSNARRETQAQGGGGRGEYPVEQWARGRTTRRPPESVPRCGGEVR